MKISIITAVYNGEKYLEETILSIINQTYKDIEYIIIDGGSTDGTLDIIKKYEKHIDYWISEKDKGMYDALNKGIFHSTGQLIGFCNSDDVIFSCNTIQEIAKTYIDNKFDCCYGDVQFIDDKSDIMFNRKALIFKIRYLITLGLPFAQPTFYWSRNLMNNTGKFNLEYKIVSDYDFIGRLLLNSKKTIKIKNKLVKFRKHGKSFGDENCLLASEETSKIKEKFRKRLKINKVSLIVYSLYDRLIQKVYQVLN